MKLTVAMLMAAAFLAAQTGQDMPGRKGDTKMPGDPGVMHPLPVPRTTPRPVPVGDEKTKARSTKSSSSKKKASGATAGSSSKQGATKKGTESPKAKAETQP